MLSCFKIIGSLLFFVCLESQAQEISTFTVRAGQSIADVLQPEQVFRFAEFRTGTVIYRNAAFIRSNMNYNNVLGEMQFINDNHDTLVIANVKEISMITFDDDTFYVNDAFLEKIAGDSSLMLLVRQYVSFRDVRKEGAYGSSSSTGAIDSYVSVSAGNNTSTYQMKVRQDMVYAMERDFYWKNAEGQFIPARKSSLYKWLPEHKDNIKKYIREKSLRWNREDHLVQLTAFLHELVL